MAKGIAYFGKVETPGIGTVWVAVGPKGLIAADFGKTGDGFVAALRRRGFFPEENPKKVAGLLTQAKQYSGGKTSALKAKIDWSVVGDFARRVLQETMEIPRGNTRSYGEVAARIGHPGAARAVGNALARNPFPLWVPCHRVIKSDGSLGGFGGSGAGARLKEYLLKLEKAL